MHIAIDARIINSSTGRYVERLIHYLEKVDTDNTYTILVREKDRDFYTPTNPNFSIQVAEFADYSFAEQIGFKKLLDELRPDLVHFCMPQQPVLYRGAAVTTIHDLTLLKTYNSDKNYLVFKLKQFIGRFVFRHIARSSRHVIVPSDFTLQEYRDFSHINPQKITRIYEAADRSPTKPAAYPSLQNKRYIMYVGSQSDYKNTRRLIEAHQLLIQRHPDLILALVGKLTGRNGVAAARNKTWSESQRHKNVLFTDFVSDAQLAWLYQHATAYVFPSLMEGFGLPGLEAMLHGTPVVSSNATCLPEVYGDAAVYFDPENTIAIADAIDTVVKDTSLQQSLIEKGKKQAAHYSWQRMAEQTHAIYLQALTSSPER